MDVIVIDTNVFISAGWNYSLSCAQNIRRRRPTTLSFSGFGGNPSRNTKM